LYETVDHRGKIDQTERGQRHVQQRRPHPKKLSCQHLHPDRFEVGDVGVARDGVGNGKGGGFAKAHAHVMDAGEIEDNEVEQVRAALGLSRATVTPAHQQCGARGVGAQHRLQPRQAFGHTVKTINQSTTHPATFKPSSSMRVCRSSPSPTTAFQRAAPHCGFAPRAP
jgi:hypothetical protein